jgi:DNA (cytosine-5)-methyltransferase 1
MRHGSLFSGIGAPELAAEWMGWETLFHCEKEEFPQQVLKYYWPDAETFSDIKKSNFKKYANKIDVLSGGFPCQPYSTAGKRLGTADDRHLWPEMLRAIREIQPRWVVGENVRGIISWNGGLVFHEVQTDLEAEGYKVLPFLLPACAVNAPHRRDRVWFIAHRTDAWVKSMCEQEIGIDGCENVTDTECARLREDRQAPSESERIENQRERVRNDDRRIGKQRLITNSDWNDERLLPRQFAKQSLTTFNELADIGGQGVTSNTYGLGLQGQSNGFGKSGFTCKNGEANYWQNFPTQSPVCGGDDGFPTDLLRQRIREDSMGCLSEKEIDKIFSKANTKFRTGSLMAYGNSMVPQEVFQIFKAIEEYDQSL